MSVQIECLDGQLDVSAESIAEWSFKDLAQDGVLCIPFKVEHVQLIVSGIEDVDVHLYNDLYKVAHFIGHNALIRDITRRMFEQNNYRFISMYLEKWNHEEYNKLDYLKFKNTRLVLISYYLIYHRGYSHLVPKYREWVKLLVENRPHSLLLKNYFELDKVQALHSEATLEHWAAFQEYMNNHLYLDKYAKLVALEKSTKPLGDIGAVCYNARPRMFGFLITGFYNSILAADNIVLVSHKNRLYKLTKGGNNMKPCQIEWSTLFDYTPLVTEIDVGVNSRIKTYVEENFDIDK